MLRSGNPALNDNVFSNAQIYTGGDISAQNQYMTLSGAVNKTGISLLLTIAAAVYAWHHPQLAGFALPCAIGAFIVAIVICFKKTWAPVLTPVYAIAEGVFLGAVSLMFELSYPGIVFNAVSLTFGVFIVLLGIYMSGAIKPSENFKLGVAAATGGICVVYLFSFIGSFFGMQMSFLHDSSPISIGISCFVILIAALNLVMDFDFIENAAEQGNVPKYMEWYAAFGLLVTLVWLYIEILRLLAKLQRR